MRSIIQQYGYLMSPEYQAFNEAKDKYRQNYDIDQRFLKMKAEIIADLKPFIEQAASKSISIQVQNNALPALKEIDNLLKNIGK